MKVIGLGHSAQVGKDELGKLLVQRHGFTRLAFADILKNLVREIFPTIDEQVDNYGWDWAKKKGARPTLVTVGNACRKHLGANVWINALEAQMQPGGRYVITDVRYRDELAWVLDDMKGYVVKVTRPGYEPLPDPADQDLLDYRAWDMVVENNGSLLDLADESDRVVNELVGKIESAKERAMRRMIPL